MGAVAPEPGAGLVHDLRRKPPLLLGERIGIGQELMDSFAPERGIVGIDVIVQVALRRPRIVGVVFLTANPAVGVEVAVKVHARCSVVVGIGDQPGDIALAAQ